MASFRYIVPALAVAGHVAAQTTTSCAAASTFTIQNGGDASALSSCSTFSGSLALATGVAGNIAIPGVQVITGSFEAIGNGSGLSSLSAPALSSIGQDFTLNGLTGLTTLDMPMLGSADTIMWNALPGLQTANTAINMTSSLVITNTGLTTLQGIDLLQADTITIADNLHLTKVNMPLDHVKTQLTISSNGMQLEVDLPDLLWAGTISVRNASSVSIPSLSAVNQSLGFYGNFFQSLSAPNLTRVGATLAFVSNDQLANLTLPQLTTIVGGLQVANNSALTAIDGFSALKDINGAALLTGVFKNVSFPAIQEVQGTFTLLSTENITDDCSYFQSIQGKSNIILGTVFCHGHDATAANQTNGTVSGSGSGTSSASGSSASPSKGAAAGLMLPTSAGVFGLLAVMLGML